MKKFIIISPQDPSDLIKRAIEILSKTLYDYTSEYPICVCSTDGLDLNDRRLIYVGTKATNSYISAHSSVCLDTPEEYNISVQNEVVIIEGFDDAGALYGAIDFYNRYVLKFEHKNNDMQYCINFFENDTLPEFEYRSAPSIKERGLWTWGHVIYDYKGYIDHMMMLKMNSVIIWNDFLPSNARDIIEYAHARNVKVIWGFSWLWDTNCAKFDMANIMNESRGIYEKFEREFAGLDVDGIYFQTFTELHTDNIDGVVIADAATKFVNNTAKYFYENHPNIEIQFGLHAISVKNKLEFLKSVDPRIRIVWEDCGAFPFAYLPDKIDDFEETVELTRRIARLRGESEKFGAVTKGLTKLDWSKFVHAEGPQYIGISTERTKRKKTHQQASVWKYLQAYWLTNADKALEMIRIIQEAKSGDACVYALVEDGMFEEDLMFPVALYAEMLWNSDADVKDLISTVAMRAYVKFA